ncbi:hypothetical protein JV173_05105 [Acholeplasma equirhinis]|uniref:hypothetical protein n=1 Tax=Acholeplasma equirhinis TaxID=555393 RepID=UPI00197A9091|nr:hypothetical protein [Acholeplasma equirhinis]MBN3490891.1 hypothetical protein [Acholeplasma equirhinis]
MNKYLIAGIKIAFEYTYDKYFKNNIEAYRYDGDEPVDHTIVVKYKETLDMPQSGMYRIFSKSVSGLKSYMTYDEGYKNIEIWIDEDTFQDVATAEYVYTGMVFLELAQRHGLLPLHGSAISYKGDVILFSAPSGTGKSTHARMWKQLFGDDVTWVNDDKPILEINEDGIFVYGAPFSGQYSSNTNKKLPLKAIVFLQQGITDEVTKLDQKEALKNLVTNTLRPTEEALWDNMLKLFEVILKQVPIYHLDASLSLNAARQIKKAIYGE